MPKQNDHRRIAWRLSGKIAGEMIVASILIDAVILALIAVFYCYPDAIASGMPGLEGFRGDLAPFFGALGNSVVNLFRSSPFPLWPLIPIGAAELLAIIGSSVRLRRAIRTQLEPLRGLRAAADAYSGAQQGDGAPQGVGGGAGIGIGLGNPEALRRMADALHHVYAGDMDAHLAPDAISDELRPLAAAINDMLARLEAAYAAQAKFVSDASHELRTPIAVIQGYANLLSRWGSEDPDALSESIDAIKTEADAMKQMVNQLLFLARGDNDTLRLDLQRTDLVPIMGEVLREELLIDESHAIEADLPEEGVFVSADPALVKQLMRILADNSLKYTPDGGGVTLSVSADRETGRALIAVQDEGQGIPEELLPHIFDRFVRADAARTRNSGGSGLGLSIAKQIAERHLGTLEVVSMEGVGSRFTAILPLL
ncbi:MAG: HAMP domain-containing histidine kinase [Clostridiales Family XIII bacterium]|nr:HAMP domain-containing histidine kinase [Clostridiales Family XIII bacterium]